MDTNTQLANDVHFLVAPLRFLWHALLWLLFLLLAPAIFAIVPVLAIRYASPDEIWLLKWLFGRAAVLCDCLLVSYSRCSRRATGRTGTAVPHQVLRLNGVRVRLVGGSMFLSRQTTTCYATGTTEVGLREQGYALLQPARDPVRVAVAQQ